MLNKMSDAAAAAHLFKDVSVHDMMKNMIAATPGVLLKDIPNPNPAIFVVVVLSIQRICSCDVRDARLYFTVLKSVKRMIGSVSILVRRPPDRANTKIYA